ncbi:MAG: enoyl-CoA hydratase/isomerase family protein [Syntrophomonadaceae bacterium]|nr:enoyl-CoA hydratase/isomerase family protein [Syntrophomonadaceae bacterium]
MFTAITVSEKEGIGYLTMNRPEKLNALNMVIREEMTQALEGFARNDDIRVIVITGAGRAFSAGGDIQSFVENEIDVISGRKRIQSLSRLLTTIVNLEKPVICAVNGIAVGAGCNLALSGDIIIAAEEAKFSEIFIKVGLVPDCGGMYFLPRLVGLPKAKELIFTGEMITAQQAKELGMINYVVPRNELDTVVYEQAKKIAAGSPIALGLAKSILNRSLSCDLPTLLELEAFAQGACFQSEEHRQLVRDFVARSKTK